MSATERNGGPTNPFAAFFGAMPKSPQMKQWETWLGQQIDRFVRNESFLGQMGKAMESSMVFKAHYDRVLEQSLRSMRLPTRTDLDEVHKRLDELDRRLDGVVDKLDALARAQAPSATPAPAPKATRARRKPSTRAAGSGKKEG